MEPFDVAVAFRVMIGGAAIFLDFRFILPAVVERASKAKSPTSFTNVPALRPFLLNLPFLLGDRSTCGLLPMLPPVWRR